MLPSMMAPKFATFTKGLLIIEGGIFPSCFLILLSIIEGVFAHDLCNCNCMNDPRTFIVKKEEF